MPHGRSRLSRHGWWVLAVAAGAVLALGAALSALPRMPLTRSAGVSTDAPFAAPSRTGAARVLEQTFHSHALGRTMPYTVYLPPGYDDSDRRYPVLYMLHGIGGDHASEWPGYGLLEAAGALTASGQLPPLIIVLPEGEDGYWVDHAADGPAWGTYLARDVVAEVDARFRTIAAPASRAVGGNSMGAHGALQVAINFPGVFGVVGAHSPTLRDAASAPPSFGVGAAFEKRDPGSLVAAHPEAARTLRITIDAGRDDPWLPSTTALHDQLVAQRIPHDFEVLPGTHDDAYWTGNVRRYLAWYGSTLAHAPP